ncbi:MAG: HypC/HybG/HupF family hydrogenase formation chaperone [Glaciecola sp.]|jgi:hydrogenase expression/formation protein HypC
MCIGIPMQIVSSDGLNAICNDQGHSENVDLSLVGQQTVGTWLLVFLGAAREVLDPASALQMQDAVNAMRSIMQGQNQVDHLFEDLLSRPPQLPPHLQTIVDKKSNLETELSSVQSSTQNDEHFSRTHGDQVND